MTCPFCGTELVQHSMKNRPVFYCTNPNCACEDGGMTLYNNPRPVDWIEHKRRQFSGVIPSDDNN